MKIFKSQNIFDKITIKNFIIKLLYTFTGAFIIGLIYNSFTVENTLVSGGVSGLAIIINKVFGIGETVFINVATISLLILSLILLGFKKTSDGIIGYTAYAIMLEVTKPLGQYVNLSFDSFLFSVIFYGVLAGVGYGLIYRTGYNTSGSDTIVAICQKYFVFPYSVISNIMNTGIIILGAMTFGITKSIYAIIYLFICNFVTDKIILGSSDSKLCLIKTKKLDELEEFIKEELEIGYTLIESTNGIGLLKKYVVMCIVPSDRFYDLKREVMLIDKKAELICNDCYTVEGGYTNHFMSV